MLSLAIAPTMSSSVIIGNHAMAKHMTPSTQWQETVASDEAQRYARYGEQFAALQARKSKKHGNGRALHRKQVTAAEGSFEVLKNLPDFARQGLFAKPGTFETWVRLSNGGMDKASDHKPDIRGFSLRVLGVSGDSAAGKVLGEQVESSIFDPWQALAAYRPLGDVMRARKAGYFVSQQARGAA